MTRFIQKKSLTIDQGIESQKLPTIQSHSHPPPQLFPLRDFLTSSIRLECCFFFLPLVRQR